MAQIHGRTAKNGKTASTTIDDPFTAPMNEKRKSPEKLKQIAVAEFEERVRKAMMENADLEENKKKAKKSEEVPTAVKVGITCSNLDDRPRPTTRDT